MVVQPARYRFTADEYHHMGAVGIFSEDDRVELIEGEIVEMSPVGDRHVTVVDRLTETLVVASAGKARVSVQNPVRLGPSSEPQPDLMLLHRESFGHGAARPDDVLVLIEVSDTTLTYDRDVKIPLYAQAGIPEVWLIDLPNGVIWRYTDPHPNGYRLIERFNRGDTLISRPLPSVMIELVVNDLVG